MCRNYIWEIVLLEMMYVSSVVETPLVPSTCPQFCSCTRADKDTGSAVNVQCGNFTSVPFTTCDQQASLLNVSFNDLGTCYRSVKFLCFQDCGLNISEIAFQNLENLKFVDLSDNGLTSIPPDLFKGNHKLETLIFRRNNLEALQWNANISEIAFQNLENLKFVDLSDNGLTSIPPDLFKGNHKLETLIFRTNNLEALQWNATLLNGPPSLCSLDLQSCRLSNLSSKTFSKLPHLEKLDISGNDLERLYSDTLSSLGQLKDVNLENNPWKCGTDFEGLLCSMLPVSHNRTLYCKLKDNMLEKWTARMQLFLCGPTTTPSVTSSPKLDMNDTTNQTPSVASSNKSDISTNTTLKPTKPSEQETETTSKSCTIWMITTAVVSFVSFIMGLITRPIVSVIRKYCDVRQTAQKKTSSLTTSDSTTLMSNYQMEA